MSWDSVPWFVGGGAEHSPEVARLLAYVAFGGRQGVLASTDLEVRELATPGTEVRAFPGACGILNRATGGSQQGYAGRLPSQDTVAIGATGSGETRSDLVVARVENPHIGGEPWSDPSDPTVGPYIFTRVIADVPSSTTRLADVEPNQSGIALARIDMPESTATVIQDYITDLRQMSGVLTDYFQESIAHGSGITDVGTGETYTDWPASTTNVTVPQWATRMDLHSVISSVRLNNNNTEAVQYNNFFGNIRHVVDGSPEGQIGEYNHEWPAGITRHNMVNSHTISAIPYQGSTVEVKLQINVQGKNGDQLLQADNGTSVVHQIYFRERPEFNL